MNPSPPMLDSYAVANRRERDIALAFVAGFVVGVIALALWFGRLLDEPRR